MTVIAPIVDDVRRLHAAGLDAATIATQLGVPLGRVVACRLSAQQIRVVELLVSGHTYREVAMALNIEPTSVRTHMRRVAIGLGLSAPRRGWITAAVMVGYQVLPRGAVAP